MLDMIMNMFLIYNAVLHSSIIIINTAIILKEIELVFLQLAKSTGDVIEGYTLKRYDLSLREMYPAFWEYFNVYQDFEKFWFWTFNYDFQDLFKGKI